MIFSVPININEANIGDCVYALLSVQSTPVFCEITRVLELEGALEVFTSHWGNRTVMAVNAYWEEKAAKKGKIVKFEHNYRQWAQEYYNNEETENNDRVDSIHNGQPKECGHSREEISCSSISKSTKRKQKVVRKSTTRKRKSTKSRKTRTSKK